ncbi:Gfo/Idh/MocA family oxidoreductase, partial [candidate division KSB1 bacterium]|nr:Gfo/Idh/MocA family oxidoreductase [candidate division KSB1 bacterium]
MYNFGRFALKYPHLMKITAIAEPDIQKRNVFIQQHQLKKEQTFETWQDLLDKPKMADALINATQDQIHYASTLRALEQGYHVLLEKPIATTVEHVFQLAQKAKKTDLIFQICFEMRYTPFFSTIKQLIDSGEIGDLVMIEHKESLIYWHMAHSFVRGNWRKAEESCPMLLAKACHDFDQLTWLVRSPCKKVSSFGGLNYFREENAPEGAPDRCI